MGAEYLTWSARVTPKHDVTLAFTRMLAGPMDYTPGGFDNLTKEDFSSARHGAEGDGYAGPSNRAVCRL